MANLRVIIVGGGIGGLTLANCLQHANIDFVLLESREKIGMHFGAGVGVSIFHTSRPLKISNVLVTGLF
jgi:2-polyprenyl-6-methoxyphenol hydroxylase-like FAD-dependent oxidoreductase